ncbi:hypothetical protein I5504_17530 [Citrobacter koseri]|uniref:hypothetical protein n=1 Tax=Citrobacter koseri TaxID=545 RepID=UPI0011C04A50|nr:hypothetical protein [Citrobacter koseri]MBJ9305509.1 hypothetical protein [Citrobacter koseri]MBJ9369363.1 hypothetical protein [Citrobacter koseri]HAT2782000.1 hypothetical protein [Citrobacter koseri]
MYINKLEMFFFLFDKYLPSSIYQGDKTGEVLVTALAETNVSPATGRQVRTHLRCGLWHGFWPGKWDGSENRKFSYRWLPPQIIGGRRNEGAISNY